MSFDAKTVYFVVFFRWFVLTKPANGCMFCDMKPRFEKIQPSVESAFSCFVRREEQFPFAWHYHPEIELTLIVAGRGQRHVGDHYAEYEPGDLVLVGSTLPHTWVSESAWAGDMHEAVVTQFPPMFVQQWIEPCVDLKPIAELLRIADRGVTFDRVTSEAVSPALRSMPEQQGPRRWLTLLHILTDLASGHPPIRLASEGFVSEPDAHETELVNKVCGWIHHHLDQPIQQREAAEMLHMSVSTFSRFFKQATGRTFTQYVVELRLGRACRMLIETQWSVTSIAYRCGFSDPAYFHRVFRRVRGVTPTRYRRKYATDVGPTR